MTRSSRCTILLLLFFSVVVSFAQVEDDTSLQDGKVHLQVMPYLIIPGMSGLGAGSRIAVNAEPFLNFVISKRLTGTVGWKFLYQDYVNTGQRFEYEILTQGLVFGNHHAMLAETTTARAFERWMKR